MGKSYCKFLLSATFIIVTTFSATAQNGLSGSVYYCLPKTFLKVSVEVEVSSFTPGPYAEYAASYFDSPARESESSVSTIKSLSVSSSVIPDNSKSFNVTLSQKNGSSEAFLYLAGKNLVCIPGGWDSTAVTWRFPSKDSGDMFVGKGLDINTITNTTTTYRQVEGEEGVETVPVTKTEEIALTEAMKAGELANTIHKLKQSRVDIITGNTDAEFQGEAMGAVISEINRLIDQYGTMFYGLSTVSVQERTFEVIPDSASAQTVVCRVSDTKGILPADSKEGRPITMYITSEKVTENTVESNESWLKTGGTAIRYRYPANSVIRIKDGDTLLVEMVCPICQNGAMSAIVL